MFPEFLMLLESEPVPNYYPLNSRDQDMEVKKGEFQIIGKAVKKEKRY